jgi:hypothetical protein
MPFTQPQAKTPRSGAHELPGVVGRVVVEPVQSERNGVLRQRLELLLDKSRPVAGREENGYLDILRRPHGLPCYTTISASSTVAWQSSFVQLAAATRLKARRSDRHDPAVRIYNVPGTGSLPLGGSSSNLQAGEIFKIDHGRIIGIEAMGASLPYGTKSGWGE